MSDFAGRLLAWYDAHGRHDLPWQHPRTPYRVWVAEVMLQQTQVGTVIGYYAPFLARFPEVAALAAASLDDVLAAWSGLGYYSRARNLHTLARAVAAMPAPPRTAAAWQELPGIGPYTSAAIASIADGEPVAVVDGNVVRILARLTNEPKRFRDGTEAVKHFTPLAAALIAGAPPGDHNQAMMELGATVCFRQKPLCLTCPVAEFCASRRAGTAETLPRLAPKKTEPMFVLRTFCLDRGRLLLHRTGAKARRLAGLHELPELAQVGVAAERAQLVATKRRAITRFQITESIYRVKADAKLRARVAKDESLEWVSVAELERITLSGPHRRWLAELLRGLNPP